MYTYSEQENNKMVSIQSRTKIMFLVVFMNSNVDHRSYSVTSIIWPFYTTNQYHSQLPLYLIKIFNNLFVYFLILFFMYIHTLIISLKNFWVLLKFFLKFHVWIKFVCTECHCNACYHAVKQTFYSNQYF